MFYVNAEAIQGRRDW